MATTGTVKFYNSTKGFGFVQPEDGNFDLETGRDGRVSAVNISLV
jgi:CspA family cold shock protein